MKKDQWMTKMYIKTYVFEEDGVEFSFVYTCSIKHDNHAHDGN